MSKVALHFKVTAKPGKGDEVVAVLGEMFNGAVDAEPGTLTYVMHRQKDNPDVIVFYEMYADDAAFAAHSQNPVLQAAGPKLGDLMAAPPEMILMEVVRAKGMDA